MSSPLPDASDPTTTSRSAIGDTEPKHPDQAPDTDSEPTHSDDSPENLTARPKHDAALFIVTASSSEKPADEANDDPTFVPEKYMSGFGIGIDWKRGEGEAKSTTEAGGPGEDESTLDEEEIQLKRKQLELQDSFRTRCAPVVRFHRDQERYLERVAEKGFREAFEMLLGGARGGGGGGGFDEDMESLRKFCTKHHGALSRSAQRARRTYDVYLRSQAEFLNDIWMREISEHKNLDDVTMRNRLKRTLEATRARLNKGLEREKAAQTKLDVTTEEINELANMIHEGVDFSSAQKRALAGLLETKQRVAAELEREVHKISELRNRIGEAAKKKRDIELGQSSRETEIIDIKEKVLRAQEKGKTATEERMKLEGDIREIRKAMRAVKDDCQAKSDQVAAVKKEIDLLEQQTRRQEIDMIQLAKERETKLANAGRLKEFTRKEASATRRAVQENKALTSLVQLHEKGLRKVESKRQKTSLVRDGIVSKNQNLQQAIKELRHERASVRASVAKSEADLDVAKRAVKSLSEEIHSLERKRSEMNHDAERRIKESELFHSVYKTLLGIGSGLAKELDRARDRVADLERESVRCRALRDSIVVRCETNQSEYVASMTLAEGMEGNLFGLRRDAAHVEYEILRSKNRYESMDRDRHTYVLQFTNLQAKISERGRRYREFTLLKKTLRKELDFKMGGIESISVVTEGLRGDHQLICDEIAGLISQCNVASQYISAQFDETNRLMDIVARAKSEKSRQLQSLKVVKEETARLQSKFSSQDEELRQAYERYFLTQREMHLGHLEYLSRLETRDSLLRAVARLSEERAKLQRSRSDQIRKRLLATRLSAAISSERALASRLEAELRRPVNFHRWKRLGNGCDLESGTAPELVHRVNVYQKKLFCLTQEDQQKAELISQIESSYLQLGCAQQSLLVTSQPSGTPLPAPGLPEVTERYNDLEKIYKDKTMQYRHMATQLSVYRAQCRENQHAVDMLDRQMKEVRKGYLEARSMCARTGVATIC